MPSATIQPPAKKTTVEVVEQGTQPLAYIVRGPLSTDLRDRLYRLVPGNDWRHQLALSRRWGVTSVIASDDWARSKSTAPAAPKGRVVKFEPSRAPRRD